MSRTRAVGPPPPPVKEEQRPGLLQAQARLILEGEQLSRKGKYKEARAPLEKALALERRLFRGATHTGLHLTAVLVRACSTRQVSGPPGSYLDLPAARRYLAHSQGVQVRFFGDQPSRVVQGNERNARSHFQQAAQERSKVLGSAHAVVGLTLLDLGLSRGPQELAKAEADVKGAVEALARSRYGTSAYVYEPADAQYHLDRLRGLSQAEKEKQVPRRDSKFESALKNGNQLAGDADVKEAAGDVAAARALWGGHSGRSLASSGPRPPSGRPTC